MDLAVNDDGRGLDLGLDSGVFADGEVAVGVDFAFDFSINDEVVGELDDAFDFHIGGKNVARGGGGRTCSWRWRLVTVRRLCGG